jgi:Tol biopolymer transport system component
MALSSVIDPETNAGNGAILVWDAATGTEVHRITVGEGEGWFDTPVWSSVDNRISFHVSQEGKANYAVYDLSAGAIVARTDYPDFWTSGGFMCGVGLTWPTSWSRDGSLVYFAVSYAGTAENGAWAWNPVTGEKRLVPASGASLPSPGPDGRIAFATDGFILIGDSDGGWPTLITSGSNPAWSPR